jgi:flagellar hook-basal body complex protein FliE
MTVPPIEPVASLLEQSISPVVQGPPVSGGTASSFSSLLLDGIDAVNTKALDADAMVRAFALDDSIPVHQVTFALEQARLSLELMMQVRGRLVDAYQQFMNMQL